MYTMDQTSNCNDAVVYSYILIVIELYYLLVNETILQMKQHIHIHLWSKNPDLPR